MTKQQLSTRCGRPTSSTSRSSDGSILAQSLMISCRFDHFIGTCWIHISSAASPQRKSKQKKKKFHRTVVLRYVGKPPQMFPDLDYCNTSIAIGCPVFPQDHLLLRFLCIICRRTAHIKFAIITSRFEIGRFTSAGLRSEKKWWNSVGLSSQFHRLIE